MGTVPQNHPLALPVSASVASRPPAHPSRAGGRGRRKPRC